MHALVASLDRGGGHSSVPSVPMESRYINAFPDREWRTQLCPTVTTDSRHNITYQL
jgi:hypothetical protein